jgi:type II secretory pathway component GspD/PulD (secretin)
MKTEIQPTPSIPAGHARAEQDFPRRHRAWVSALALAASLAAPHPRAFAQDSVVPPPATPAPEAGASAPAPPAAPQVDSATATNSLAAPETADAGTNGLRLNFRNAPIDLVLNYLSDAAGFIIELDTTVHGNVSVISSHPMTQDEAVDLLNSVLNKNGYAAIRTGRTLKIMDKSSAKTSNSPVKISNDPDSIPNNDEMVTQIIPIRFVEASQLVTDLSPFVSSGATIIANQAGNSIVITDTQANIRHLVEIIRAIDSSAEDVTELRVFKLQYADPSEMAGLLMSLFPDQSGGNAQVPIRFGGRGGGAGGRGGGFGGPFGGGPFGAFGAAMAANAGGGNPQNERIKKRTQVVAVADPRTSSVVVTATKDLMEQITAMIKDLDFKSKKETTVRVFHLNNADPQEILPTLQDMFQGNNVSRNRNSSSQNSALMSRTQQNQNTANNNNSMLGGFGTGQNANRTGGFGN